MKKTSKIFDLNKKSISKLNDYTTNIKGGNRANIGFPTGHTDPTYCSWCIPETF